MQRDRAVIWAAVCLAALTLLFLSAGTWQLARARYKEQVQARVVQAADAAIIHVGAEPLDVASTHLRRVEVQGTWLPERTILLDNKISNGVVGYEVVTPLRIAADRNVLVNRGWIKAPPLRSELPLVVTPPGSLLVQGIARVPSERFIELGTQQITGTVWQNLTIARYQDWSGLPLQPFVIYQGAPDGDGLQRVLPAPEAAGLNADRHRGYALTWFLLAGVTIVLGTLAWRQHQTNVKQSQ